MKVKVTKEMFVAVLELLEEEDVFSDFEFLTSGNTIRINQYGDYGTDSCYFNFDELNNLIDPRIRKYQEELAALKAKEQDLIDLIKELGGNA